NGQVHRHGTFPDAALTTAHSNDAANATGILAAQPTICWHLRVPFDVQSVDARHLPDDSGVAAVDKYVLERAGRRSQHDREAGSITSDRQVADHVEADDVAVQLGFDDRRK